MQFHLCYSFFFFFFRIHPSFIDILVLFQICSLLLFCSFLPRIASQWQSFFIILHLSNPYHLLSYLLLSQKTLKTNQITLEIGAQQNLTKSSINHCFERFCFPSRKFHLFFVSQEKRLRTNQTLTPLVPPPAPPPTRLSYQ